MVRFIDIGDQITLNEGDGQFAWWNTIVDVFMDFNDNQVWDNWLDFCHDYGQDNPWGKRMYPLERFERLLKKNC